MSVQKNWKWCNRCDSLFYADQPNTCTLGGPHNSTGSGFYLASTAPTGGAQDGWRWCKKCGVMAYSGVNAGQCAVGGGHDFSGSGAYAIHFAQPSTFAQSGWRWCNKCQGLFFGGRAGGACKAGGAHLSEGSGNYFMGYQIVGSGIAIAHESLNNGGDLWLTLYQNGGWTDLRIPGGCSGAPSPVMFNNKLYIFYQGRGDCKDLWYTIFDGTNFSESMQAPNIRLSGSPQAVYRESFRAKEICISLRGTSGAQQAWCILYDSNRWTSLDHSKVIGTACDPIGVVVPKTNGNALYTIYEDPDSLGTLKMLTWDGTYTVMNCASSFAPAAVMFKDKMHIFHQGPNGNGKMYYKAVDIPEQGKPDFPHDIQLDCGMSASPAPVVDGETLYVFHEGFANNGELWYMSYDGTTWAKDQRVPGVGVSKGCGATRFNFNP